MQCILCVSLSGLCIACWQLDVGLALLNSFTQFHNALCSLLPVCGGKYLISLVLSLQFLGKPSPVYTMADEVCHVIWIAGSHKRHVIRLGVTSC